MAKNKVKKAKNKKKQKSRTQKHCDSLLTPIIKKLSPKCLLCGSPTEVAHHFIRKSVSLNLRYNFKNLIPLCNKHHFLLHFNDEGLWNGRITLIMGKDWLDYLEKNKRTIIKPNYNEIYETLKRLLTFK